MGIINRLLDIIGVFAGIWLAVAVGALAPFFVTGWLKTGIFYAVVLASMWVFLTMDTWIDYWMGRAIGRLTNLPTLDGHVYQKSMIWSKYPLLIGMCAGFVACAIWAPLAMLKLVGSIRL